MRLHQFSAELDRWENEGGALTPKRDQYDAQTESRQPRAAGQKRAITLRRVLPVAKIHSPRCALGPKEVSMTFERPEDTAMPDPESPGAQIARPDKRVIPPAATRTTGTLHLPGLSALRPAS